MLALAVGCVGGWGATLWLVTQTLRLEMEVDTFVRLAAKTKATEASLRGTPYFFRATNNPAASISTIVATHDGIPVRLYPILSANDALFVHVYNEETSRLLER
jgi:hypothetical protein